MVNNLPIPTGKIIADNSVSAPVTSYDLVTSTWTTKVPPGFASTSDLFVAGVIINSSTGFVKLNNAKTIVKGIFYSNRNYRDQWAYASAAYQPQFTYASIAGAGQVVSVNGNYRAGTPTTITGAPLSYLVNGGSGGGGNNYSGSTNSYDRFTACLVAGATSGNFAAERSAVSDDNLVAEQRKEKVRVTPNPANDFVNVSFIPGETGAARIGLYTLEGKKIFEQETGVLDAGFMYAKKIDVSGLTTGVYVIHVKGSKEIITKKVMISH
jgi:hypothetical protein